MNWDSIGAIAELLGAVGVMVTLLYLASQIRQNTRSSQAAAHQSITEASATMNSMVAADPDVARLWAAAFSGDMESLPAEDKLRFRFIAGQWLVAFESLYIQHQLGNLGDEFFHAKMQNLKNLLKGPGVLEVWRGSQTEYAKSFRQYVATNLIGTSTDVPRA